ncbi:MAG: DUF378 domain-containing protein [Clostridia bacterium]|nr:DUF378 domain-containing protein [Clostridia bacterium]
MLTIIAFILSIAGCINWLLIGLLQYDFVAGIFGLQSSIFSRIIYIIIGAASVFLVFKLIKNKGSLPVFTWRNKKDLSKNIAKMTHKKDTTEERFARSNTESSEELDLSKFESNNRDDLREKKEPKGLFDEHFEERK